MTGDGPPDGSDDGPGPAWYATGGGGWRDWWTLLHPPYTLWHLGYVAIGAGLSPRFDAGRFWATLAAFLLALGVAAHALDELHDRPLRTSIPDRGLRAAAAVGLGGAALIGVIGIASIPATPGFRWVAAGLVVLGVGLVLAYNLEAFGGRLHTDAGFAAAWGAFPVVVAYVAQAQALHLPGVLAAGGAFALSRGQRSLSTPARTLRRRTRRVRVEVEGVDGVRTVAGADVLLDPVERALRAFAVGVPLLGAALVAARSLG